MFELSSSPLFWLIAVTAVTFVGISKGGFGGGVGIIATPLMALAMSVSDAAALLLPILIAADMMNAYHYRNDWDKENVKLLIPAGIVGVAIGGFFFTSLAGNDRAMKVGIGLLALLFVLYQAGRAYFAGQLEQYKPTRAAGIGLGMASGFTSTLVHAGGPPLTMYLLPQKLPRNVHVATFQIYITVINLVKLIPYIWLGLLNIGNLTTALILIPCAFIGLLIGQWLNRNFNDKGFQIFIYILLFATGIQLVLGRSLLSLFTT